MIVKRGTHNGVLYTISFDDGELQFRRRRRLVNMAACIGEQELVQT